MQTNNTKQEAVEGKKEKKPNADEEHQFNWFQKWVCPIHLNELPMVLPVIMLMATALFVYTGYRDVKDPIVYSGEGQSMMTIQYCKVVVMLASVPVAALYLKLDNMVSRNFVFFQTILTFASFFILNGVLLYPFRDALHSLGSNAIRSICFNMSDNNVERVLPLIGTVILPVNTFTYVFSELWGTISVSFLVWGYVNQITPKAAARRYYAVLGIGGQFGSMLGGVFVDAVTHSTAKKTPETFVNNMRIVNLVMAAMCILFAGTYALLEFYVMKKPEYAVKAAAAPAKKAGAADEPKMSVGEAFSYCLKNYYVLALCGMVFAYGFVMVLGELTYKDLMKLSFDGEQNMYASFKARETSICAIVAIVLMIFVAHNVIRICGWLTTALMAPVMAGVLSMLLYVMALTGGDLYVKSGSGGDAKYFKNEDRAGYLDVLKWVGLAFAVATKSVKYSSFDPAKELAFLSLNSEQKYKAKAAVDIIGARFGKGGGALFNILILNIAFSARVSYLTPCLIASLAGILFGLVLWVWSDVYINAHKEEVAEANKKLAMAKAAPLESVQVEGTKTTVTEGNATDNIEMANTTKSPAKATDGQTD